jgi:hypothetical protein
MVTTPGSIGKSTAGAGGVSGGVSTEAGRIETLSVLEAVPALFWADTVKEKFPASLGTPEI